MSQKKFPTLTVSSGISQQMKTTFCQSGTFFLGHPVVLLMSTGFFKHPVEHCHSTKWLLLAHCDSKQWPSLTHHSMWLSHCDNCCLPYIYVFVVLRVAGLYWCLHCRIFCLVPFVIHLFDNNSGCTKTWTQWHFYQFYQQYLLQIFSDIMYREL